MRDFQTASIRIFVGLFSFNFFASASVSQRNSRAFVVQFHARIFAGAAAGVIQQHEMRVAIKFLRVDAILHEHEFDVRSLSDRFPP